MYKLSSVPHGKCNSFQNNKFKTLSSILKEFAGNNFKFLENDKHLSKQEENTVGKGQIVFKRQQRGKG